MASRGSAVVDNLTNKSKVEGSNPVTDTTLRKGKRQIEPLWLVHRDPNGGGHFSNFDPNVI